MEEGDGSWVGKKLEGGLLRVNLERMVPVERKSDGRVMEQDPKHQEELGLEQGE